MFEERQHDQTEGGAGAPVGPGATLLTLIPRLNKSRAAAMVSEWTPPLEAA